MRAVVTETPGGPSVLALGEVPTPSPGPGQLLVRVRAAALNHADMLQREGEFPPAPGESPILGVEIAGDVVACGSGSRTAVATPVFGLVGGGAYADYCVIDEQMAFEIPLGLSYAEAASLPEVYFTADTTMFRLGGLSRGQAVLVHGGGSGLGTACIQMAKHAGARVACTVGSAAKAERARALGADLAIDYGQRDFVADVRVWTAGEGVDLVEDIVGADYFTRNLAALRDGGRLLQVGILSGTICTLDLDTIVLRRLHLIGSVMRPLPIEGKRAIARRFRERWLPLLAARRLSPVIDSVFALADVAKAHERLGRSEHFGKIILDLFRANDPAAPTERLEANHVRSTRPNTPGQTHQDRPAMKRLDITQVKSSLIDISPYDLTLGGIDTVQTGELPRRVARALLEGYCVCHGTAKVLARHGLDVRKDRQSGYELLESVFQSALALIDMRPFSVTSRPMTLNRMDVDGYNLNQQFSHDGQIASRAFMTAKCIHFDAATPFIANIYGPNKNVKDGLPLICDVKQYCRDRGVKPASMVDNLPNNYNIALRSEFYSDLLYDYSFAYDLDLENDIIVVMLLNEIEYGVAHGATDPSPRVAGQPVERPIRHIELQYGEEPHYDEWYAHYNLKLTPAVDYAGENLSLPYHGPLDRPFENIIPAGK